MTELRDEVREKYAKAALTALDGGGGCCGPQVACCDEDASFGAAEYDAAMLSEVPTAAALASLGCGNPIAVAELREGETVLDLGSGGGIDVILSARRVGPAGKAYGLDMTDEMLDLARKNAAEAGVTNVEFLRGYIEEVPLPAGSVDVIVSNCVINLSTDKARVFDEMFRVLKPGGRLGITDIVAADELTPEQRAERGNFVGCIAGAMSFAEFERELTRVGFAHVEVRPTHDVADRMYGAIVRAVKP
jgi:arsenite methyltransferase